MTVAGLILGASDLIVFDLCANSKALFKKSQAKSFSSHDFIIILYKPHPQARGCMQHIIVLVVFTVICQIRLLNTKLQNGIAKKKLSKKIKILDFNEQEIGQIEAVAGQKKVQSSMIGASETDPDAKVQGGNTDDRIKYM